MKVFIHDRPDGRVSITPIHPLDGETEANAIIRIHDRNIEVGNFPTGGIGIEVVDESILPGGSLSQEDREFRKAWGVQGGVNVVVDLARSRDIQELRIEAAKLRKARELVEREMLGENITAEQAQLRAINARAIVDAAQNIAALKAAWPPGLDR